MASIVFFILFITLTTAIHARESQFFAKVSNNIPKQETQQQTLTNTNQQDPTFIPQSQDSAQLPASTTTTNNGLPANLPENYNPVAYTTPIHSSTQDIPEEFTEPQTFKVDNKMYDSEKQEEFMGTNGGNMYNYEKQEVGTNGGNMDNYEKQGMSDTRFIENGRYNYNGDNGYNSEKQGFNDASFMQTEDSGNMYNSQKQGGNEMYNSQGGFNDASFMETEDNGNMYNNQQQGESQMYNSEKQGSGSNNGNMFNTGKQGMSDTRFLENGKYYYDLNSERLNANANMNSRGVRNGFNTQGYYGNNENTYDKYNTNGGY